MIALIHSPPHRSHCSHLHARSPSRLHLSSITLKAYRASPHHRAHREINSGIIGEKLVRHLPSTSSSDGSADQHAALSQLQLRLHSSQMRREESAEQVVCHGILDRSGFAITSAFRCSMLYNLDFAMPDITSEWLATRKSCCKTRASQVVTRVLLVRCNAEGSATSLG